MLCGWLTFKVDIQLFLSYGVYASVIIVIFFAEVKYMISPSGGGYISKVVSKLRNNALSVSTEFSSVSKLIMLLPLDLPRNGRNVLKNSHGFCFNFRRAVAQLTIILNG